MIEGVVKNARVARALSKNFKKKNQKNDSEKKKGTKYY